MVFLMATDARRSSGTALKPRRLARALSVKLMDRDPLSEKVHFGKAQFIGNVLIGLAQGLAKRPGALFSRREHETA